jgi:ABC-type glutathione transport system ATPase component
VLGHDAWRESTVVNTLEVNDLTVDYVLRREHLFGPRERMRAVDAVGFQVSRGTTLALVGESGSGKTSVARAILGLVPIASGHIRLDGIDIAPGSVDPSAASVRRRIQMVFQQPSGSLDPRMRVSASVAEPLVHLTRLSGSALQERVLELLNLVGLDASYATRYPRQLSGGQRQRVAIARAIAVSPSLVICDEPTSALDVSVQAQVLNLLVRLQAELGLSYLFISHDLAVVRQVADTVAVLHHGQLIELGPTQRVLGDPQDPYTRGLLEAVPSLDGPVGQDSPAAADHSPDDGSTHDVPQLDASRLAS